jgi:hypothetical protein
MRAHDDRSGRLVVGIVLGLTLLQLLVGTFAGLPQFDGKGFGYRLAAYPVLMLVAPFVWWRTHRGRDVAVPWGAFALVMAPFLVDVTGNTLDLYDTIDVWDNLNHFANWWLLLWGLGLLLAPSFHGSGWALALVVVGLGAVLAIGWEVGEWYTFIRRGTELDRAYEDTLSDELLGTLGAACAAVVLTWRRRPATADLPG